MFSGTQGNHFLGKRSKSPKDMMAGISTLMSNLIEPTAQHNNDELHAQHNLDGVLTSKNMTIESFLTSSSNKGKLLKEEVPETKDENAEDSPNSHISHKVKSPSNSVVAIPTSTTQIIPEDNEPKGDQDDYPKVAQLSERNSPAGILQASNDSKTPISNSDTTSPIPQENSKEPMEYPNRGQNRSDATQAKDDPKSTP